MPRDLRTLFDRQFDHVFYVHLYDDVDESTREGALAHYLRHGWEPPRLASRSAVTPSTLHAYQFDATAHRQRYHLQGYRDTDAFCDWVLRDGPYLNGRYVGPVREAALTVVHETLPREVTARSDRLVEQVLRQRATVRTARKRATAAAAAAATVVHTRGTVTVRALSTPEPTAVADVSSQRTRVPTVVLEAFVATFGRTVPPLDPLRALGVDAVYVLNLVRRPDRRCRMALQLARVGIPADRVTYFAASDGASEAFRAQHDAYVQWLAKDPPPEVHNRLESVGALACYVSYRRLCAHVLNHTTCRRVLFLEDDACFHQDFWEVWNTAVVDPSADVVRLGANQRNWDHCQVSGGTYEVPRRKYHWAMGLFACILNRTALTTWHADLTAEGPAFLATSDLQLWHTVQTHELRDIVLFPNAVVADVSNSDIRDARDTEGFGATRRWDLSRYVVVAPATDATRSTDAVAPATDATRSTDAVAPATDATRSTDAVARWVAADGHRCFVFVVPSFNNADWVVRNVASMCSQTHPHWRAIYVNDASTDDTLALARQAAAAHGCTDRFTFVNVPVRRHQAHARYVAYHHTSCVADDIAVMLDGDDWLLDNGVLTTLDRLYRTEDLVATYGQYVEYQNGEVRAETVRGATSYPPDVVAANRYREHGKWLTPHLRTAEMRLLQQMPTEYLQHDAQWIRCCTDVAEMMFVLERSDGRHRNAGRPLLVYNKDNSTRYANSYYHQHQQPVELAYRQRLLTRYFAGPVRVRPTGGLGNKLRVVLSWYQRCAQQGRRLDVCWKTDDACPGFFLDWFAPLPNTSFHTVPTGTYDYVGCSTHPDVPQYVCAALQLRPHLVDRIRTVIRTMGQYVAVHVRRTDHVSLAKQHDCYTTDEAVHAFLDSHPTLDAYVASDNADTYHALRDRYPLRIPLSYHSVVTNAALRHTYVQDAVVDLYVCAAASEFFGSGWSSFTDTIRQLRATPAATAQVRDT